MYNKQIVNAINHHDLVNDSTLHVVTSITNPVRYHSRYRLFREFQDHISTFPNVKLYVAEAAFGDRHHEVTSADCSEHLQLRTNHVLWHKENLLNLAVRDLLPRNWKYVAWVDADVMFQNPNWAIETIHALQHHHVVQPWSECLDMGPFGNAIQMFTSFCSLEAKGIRQQVHKDEPYKYGHSGFAWACTKAFWEMTGGLMDFPILGSSDHHMAWALLNKVDWTIHQKMSDTFKRRCHEWQTNAFRMTRGNVGYVPGLLHHQFHGPKGRRGYRERWQILIDNQYCPDKDLRRDSQGLLYLADHQSKLEEDILKYFSSRHEDSVEQE